MECEIIYSCPLIHIQIRSPHECPVIKPKSRGRSAANLSYPASQWRKPRLQEQLGGYLLGEHGTVSSDLV